MNVTFETLAVLSVLLPGFLASAILNAVVVRQPQDAVSRLFEAFAFSAAIYSIPVVFLLIGGLDFRAFVISIQSGVVPPNAGYFVLTIIVLMVLVPILTGTSITHDFHMGLLRKLKVTNKTARDTVWFDVFTDISDRYVVVNLSDGRRSLGWPQYYANTPEEGMIYLNDPYWINNRGENISLGRHGILVKKELIHTIEFLQELSLERQIP